MDLEDQILAIRDRGSPDEQIAELRKLQSRAMRDLRVINNGILEIADCRDSMRLPDG